MDRAALAANLAVYRKTLLQLTQKELAAVLGYSVQTVSNAESRKGRANIEYVMAFAHLANISIDALCGREHKMICVDGLTENQIRQLLQQVKEMHYK